MLLWYFGAIVRCINPFSTATLSLGTKLLGITVGYVVQYVQRKGSYLWPYLRVCDSVHPGRAE